MMRTALLVLALLAQSMGQSSVPSSVMASSVKPVESVEPLVISKTGQEGPGLPAPLLRISGRVVREWDVPERQSDRRDQVGLSGPGLPAEGKVVRPSLTPIGPDDTFEFSNLAPGVYGLSVLGDGLTMPYVRITLKDKDVTGYTLNLPRSSVRAAVSVSATVVGGGPLPWFQLRLMPPPEAPPRPGQQHTFGIASQTFPPPDNPGTIELRAVPAGEYMLVVGGGYGQALPDGYSLESARAGNIDLLSERLSLAPGDRVKISVVLRASSPPPGSKVSGRVIGNNGPARIGVGGPIGLVTPVGADGAFEFPHVLSGRYLVMIFPSMDSSEGVARIGNLLVAGGDVTSLEIPAALPLFTVTGRGLGETELRRQGRLGSEQRVWAILSDEGPGEPMPQAPGFLPGIPAPIPQKLEADGSFKFTGVRPGNYKLLFSTSLGPEAMRAGNPKGIPVIVAEKDIEGLVVEIGPALVSR